MTRFTRQAERLVLEAAVRWWKSKRPLGWTHRQHLDDPAVNLSDRLETDLAWTLARMLEAKRREPVYAKADA